MCVCMFIVLYVYLILDCCLATKQRSCPFFCHWTVKWKSVSYKVSRIGLIILGLGLLDWGWDYCTGVEIIGLGLGLLDCAWDYCTGVGIIGLGLGLLDCAWDYCTGVGIIVLGLGLLDWGWDYWTGVGTIHVALGLLDWDWDHTYLGLGLGPYMYYTCISVCLYSVYYLQIQLLVYLMYN